MINGKTITILTVAWGNEVGKATDTLYHCNYVFPFFDEKKIILSINNLIDYNTFMVEKINEFVKTDYVMIVQSDGFITNPHLWKNEFLNYDYIGAPWPWYNVCGNGGFCIRSKKFIQASSELKYNKTHPEYSECPEDNFLCLPQYNRSLFENKGIKFADVKTALDFSFEHPIKQYPNHIKSNSFGFHGKHNIDII